MHVQILSVLRVSKNANTIGLSCKWKHFDLLQNVWLQNDSGQTWLMKDGFLQWVVAHLNRHQTPPKTGSTVVVRWCYLLCVGLSRNTCSPAGIAIFWWTQQARKPCDHVVPSQKVWKTSLKACRRQVFRLCGTMTIDDKISDIPVASVGVHMG